jgi:hypothetical protein
VPQPNLATPHDVTCLSCTVRWRRLHKLETEQSQLQARVQEVQAAHAAAELINSSCQEMMSLVKDQQMELVQVCVEHSTENCIIIVHGTRHCQHRVHHPHTKRSATYWMYWKTFT